MYSALRFFAFLLKIMAVINLLMTIIVYVVAQFAAFTYSIPLVVFLGTDFDPQPFIIIFSLYSAALWIIFACIGVYAFAQYIDAFLSIERNVREIAGHPLYQGYDERPRRNMWEER